MSTILLKIKRPTSYIVGTLIPAPFLAIGGVYLAWLGVAAADLETTVYGACLLVVSVGIPLLALRFEIRLTDSAIEQSYLRERRIEYHQITKVVAADGKVTFVSSDNKIALEKCMTNREQALQLIAEKLLGRTDIAYEGERGDLAMFTARGVSDARSNPN